MKIRRFLPLFLTVAFAGCYTYRPVDLADVAPGIDLRARVSSARADSLEAQLNRDSRVLEGSVAEVRGDVFFVDVPVNQDTRGIRVETLAQRLRVPAADILEAEIRELDRPRTFGGMAVAAAIVGYFVYDQLTDDTGLTGDPNEPTPTESIRIPLVRLLFGGR